MKIVAKLSTRKGTPDLFTGDVWIDQITDLERFRVNVVRFTPGARTAWHSHALGQTLHVTEGVGRVQQRDGQILEVRSGDTIWTPAGEWHWHGGAPDHFMTHLAIWEAPAEGAESAWGEHVSDTEYNPR